MSQNKILRQALSEASGHIHYWLLIAGFFVCGFQLAFITVHMPSYLADKGFDSSVAAISLSIIGLCNIVGSLVFWPSFWNLFKEMDFEPISMQQGQL